MLGVAALGVPAPKLTLHSARSAPLNTAVKTSHASCRSSKRNMPPSLTARLARCHSSCCTLHARTYTTSRVNRES
jgi:hypothetical protein